MSEFKFTTIEEIQQEMRDNLEAQLPKLTVRDKELLKEHSKPTEFVGFKDGKSYFYEKDNCRTIYAHQICENEELYVLKNKLCKLGIGDYCSSIGLSIQFFNRI